MNNYISSPAVRASQHPFGVALVANPQTDPRDLPAYRSPDGQVWFGGRVGQEFGIELIVPDDGRRFGAIVALDGVNTYTGNISSGDISQEGHWVFTPPTYRGANILPGWPTPGGKSFAAFTFARQGEGYAAKRGFDSKNSGVIGVRFFFELCSRPQPRSNHGVRTRGLSADYGREIEGKVHKTCFTGDPSRDAITLVVRFAEEDFLVAAGFTRINPSELPWQADPFPGASKIPGCPPPSGWPHARR